MKNNFRILSVLAFAGLFIIPACQNSRHLTPDLSKINDPDTWTVTGRKVTLEDGGFHMEKKMQEGRARLNQVTFENGRIELDIKGMDNPGSCFVGVMFHGVDEKTFDMIYFRPFNFRNPDRANHSVQYVAMPSWDWDNLRELHPGVYENAVNPVPDPDDWFHASIVVQYPEVSVFVNNADKPSLTVSKLDTVKQGWLALWTVGNSDVWFRNLEIYPE